MPLCMGFTDILLNRQTIPDDSSFSFSLPPSMVYHQLRTDQNTCHNTMSGIESYSDSSHPRNPSGIAVKRRAPDIDFPIGLLDQITTPRRRGRPRYRFTPQKSQAKLHLSQSPSSSMSFYHSPSRQQTPSPSESGFNDIHTLHESSQCSETTVNSPSHRRLVETSSFSSGRVQFEASETRRALLNLAPTNTSRKSATTLPDDHYGALSETVPNAVQNSLFLRDKMSRIRNSEAYMTEEIRVEDVPRFFNSQVSSSTKLPVLMHK